MSTRHALVTGDAGFLGRHFAAELRARGYDVTGIDVARGDAEDARRLFDTGRVQSSGGWDLVVHCAAVVGGRERIDGDPLSLAVNLELDAGYARWLARTRPVHAVYVSSSAVYPVDLQQRDHAAALVESHQNVTYSRIGTPDQVYGWTKLVGERLMLDVTRRFAVPVTVVRPFSGYGADQSTDYPFPAFVERARRRDDPFVVWGDGTQTRDFVHVDDVVNATLAQVARDGTAFARGIRPRPVNVCTGVGTSFRTLARLLIDAVGDGYDPAVKTVDGRPVGVQHRVGDPTLLRSIYVPRVTLAEGIARAIGANS